MYPLHTDDTGITSCKYVVGMYVNFCMYVCTYMYIHVHCTNLIVILWPLAKFACLICQCQLRYLLISNQRHSESKRGMNIWERTSLFVVAWCAKKYSIIEFQADRCGLYSELKRGMYMFVNSKLFFICCYLVE